MANCNNNNNNTYKRFLQLKMITKYGIFTLAFLSLSYCVLCYFGFDVSWTYMIFFTFAMLLRFILSKAFGLCWIHRACIFFNFCVSMTIVTKDETLYKVFGLENHQIMGILGIIGIILFGLVFWKVGIKKSC